MQPQDCSHLFIVTGGPGAGKSTLIEALRHAGFATAPEAGRAIIRSQQAIGGKALPDADRALYAELMLAMDLRSHQDAAARSGPVFFDRGIPDTLGYLRLIGLPEPAHMRKAAELFRYNTTVFIAPPWPGIYATDTERRQSLDEAERTYDAMRAVYAELGYNLEPLPLASVQERLEFVLARTKSFAS